MANTLTYEELQQKVKELAEEAAKDVSKQKSAEYELQESEEKWRSLAETAPCVILRVQQNGTIQFLNRTVGNYNPGDTIGTKVWDYVLPDHHSVVREAIEHVFQTGSSTSYEVLGAGPDGPASAWYMTQVGPIVRDGRVVAVTMVSTDITERKRAVEALRQREAELENKTHRLEEVNAALRVLLEKRDGDRRELEEKVLFNVKELVAPYLEKLRKTKLALKQLTYLGILESNLNDIISPFSRTLSSKLVNLTPTEIRVANLVKAGKTSQEIAEVMCISSRTVESHRDTIRKKLDLRNRKANLRSQLLSI